MFEKELYQEAEMEIIELDVQDVVTASVCFGGIGAIETEFDEF